MLRTGTAAIVLLLTGALMPPALAASFDCTKAGTAFEHAICDVPDLSVADEVMAKAFATAIGGLTKPAASFMRADQRDWLDFAARSCTDDGELLTGTARYDEEQAQCLEAAFGIRTRVLEGSRMLGGHRFFVSSSYATEPDPDGVGDPDYFWKMATHAVSVPQLDGDDPLAEGFNAFIAANGPKLADAMDPSAEDGQASATSDSDDSLVVISAGPGRITSTLSTYWYGHGAAHGNGGTFYLHYLPKEGRGLEASDVFTGAGWEQKLLDLAVAQLNAAHGEWLMLDDPKDIAGAVIDPKRWSFDSDYGLTVQFQPYEVAPYVYGAPTILLSWESLEDIKANNADPVRYGF